jgi:hypothetical protein
MRAVCSCTIKDDCPEAKDQWEQVDYSFGVWRKMGYQAIDFRIYQRELNKYIDHKEETYV